MDSIQESIKEKVKPEEKVVKQEKKKISSYKVKERTP